MLSKNKQSQSLCGLEQQREVSYSADNINKLMQSINLTEELERDTLWVYGISNERGTSCYLFLPAE